MIIRLISFFLNISLCFSYTINYELDNNTFDFVNNNFYVKNSNGTISMNQSTYDIYRLEFIISDPKKINYEIKHIKWKKVDNIIFNSEDNNLVTIGNTFIYRGCSSSYVDIFPYKIIDNNFFYLESINLEFTIDDDTINNECQPSEDIINKSFFSNNFNYLNEMNEVDYIIITNSDLLEAAENLKDIHNDLNVNIISVSSIYNLYSELDFEYAIREFIINEINNTPSLNYLLILGDETVVPPIYNGTVPSDDYYSSVNLFSANPQLSTGRIPVTNISDAISVIQNIDDYIDNLYFPLDNDNLWRMRVNLISDDENNPNPNKYPELSHTENSHIIYEQIKENLIPYTFYGIDYEPIQNSDGLLHTELTSDLIENINSGAALINYIGHGDYNTLADERILELDRDINLFNIDNYKLPIWVVGTCSFGEYDGKDSMAEALLLNEKSSIAVISTSRGIGETSNINYLTKFFNKINQYVEVYDDESRLGDIYRNAKNNSSSEHLFHLFGDPALPLPFPKFNNIIDNQIPENLFIGANVSLDVGPYNGSINILGNEKNVIRIYEEGDSVNYKNKGQSIYRGDFYQNVCFITPIDASECQDCARAYIQIKDNPYNYFQNIMNLNIEYDQDELEDIINQDILGPQIDFYTEDHRQLFNQDNIFENSFIIVKITDHSGINLMDGLGHSIRYWINDEQNQTIIDNEQFNYISSCDSTSVGEFKIESEKLYLGNNQLFVEAWDNFNNKTLSLINLNLENSSFKAYDVYNFPNPFKKETHFTFKISEYPSKAKISIFNLDGRRLKVIDNQECLNTFCSVFWDGKNSSGNYINNGTYIYHLELRNNNKIFKNLYKVTKLK